MNLTTGYSQTTDDLYQQRYLQETMVVLGVFTEDATKLSGLYCLHSGRHLVTREDIKLALKTRAFYGDLFWNRSDIQQRLAEMRDFLNQDYEDSDYEYDENIDEEMSDIPEEMEENTEENEPFIISSCTCEVCTTLNSIEEKWILWNPTEPMEISIKNSIDQTFANDLDQEEDLYKE